MENEGLTGLLESGFRDYGVGFVRNLLVSGKVEEADNLLEILETDFSRDSEIQALRGFAAFFLNRVREATLYYRNAGFFDKDFDAQSYTVSLRSEMETNG